MSFLSECSIPLSGEESFIMSAKPTFSFNQTSSLLLIPRQTRNL